MLTVGQIAKRYALSRSTLLYYDSKGVLKPSGRSDSNYRIYSDRDVQKLERIILFRNAGLSLAEIVEIIDSDSDEVEDALEKRLFAINKEIKSLRQQQGVIINLIKNQGNLRNTRIMTKERWISMLRSAGLDEAGMRAWHIEFEKNSPEAHQDFLESIGISANEITAIRNQSKTLEKTHSE
jgi:DNA-binding transcriptional MerR regulator